MARREDHAQEHEMKIDLTPMIDMTFLLVMFFILTSSFVLLEEVALPVALQAEDLRIDPGSGNAPVIITVRQTDDQKREAVLVYNGEEQTPESLLAALKIEVQLHAAKYGWEDANTKMSKLKVVIRSDATAQGTYLRKVFQACSNAGIWKVVVAAIQR